MKKVRLVIFLMGIVGLLAVSNWIYQVVNNPAVLLNIFGQDSYKSTRSTWKTYGDLFESHATPVLTPKFLAALAQVESAGNPMVTPQWRWRLTSNILRIYAPASTSAGLYQYTRPTFVDAKRFCIHNHKVVLKGLILDPTACWFNIFYSRFWPSHAIEMTSARLHYYQQKIVDRRTSGNASLPDRQKLAAVIHLCGLKKGDRFAKAGYKFNAIGRCGSHNPQSYYKRIRAFQKRF